MSYNLGQTAQRSANSPIPPPRNGWDWLNRFALPAIWRAIQVATLTLWRIALSAAPVVGAFLADRALALVWLTGRLRIILPREVQHGASWFHRWIGRNLVQIALVIACIVFVLVQVLHVDVLELLSEVQLHVAVSFIDAPRAGAIASAQPPAVQVPAAQSSPVATAVNVIPPATPTVVPSPTSIPRTIPVGETLPTPSATPIPSTSTPIPPTATSTATQTATNTPPPTATATTIPDTKPGSILGPYEQWRQNLFAIKVSELNFAQDDHGCSAAWFTLDVSNNSGSDRSVAWHLDQMSVRDDRGNTYGLHIDGKDNWNCLVTSIVPRLSTGTTELKCYISANSDDIASARTFTLVIPQIGERVQNARFQWKNNF